MIDHGKDLRKAFDNGFVIGALALAAKLELDEVDVAAFLKEEHHIDFNAIDEPKRTWCIRMLTSHGLLDDDPHPDTTLDLCNNCLFDLEKWMQKGGAEE